MYPPPRRVSQISMVVTDRETSYDWIFSSLIICDYSVRLQWQVIC